ncbi:hypothetical protein [Micromonospora parva]|uniref:hypothetical protein n=1 Tax=Micromonospora parva TaxID=1464048 RepID=UPI00365BF7F5
MIIVYTPEGDEEQKLDAGRLRTSEIQIVERTTGMVWPDIRTGLQTGSVTAIRAVAWVLLKRTRPSIAFDEFNPFEDELAVRLDQREVEAFAKIFVSELEDKPDELQAAMAELQGVALDEEHAAKVIAEAQEPGPKAKDESPSTTST